jgi:hypothetical protein
LSVFRRIRKKRLSGGYDKEPEWLSGERSLLGVLEKLMPGQGPTPAAVVKIDQPMVPSRLTDELLLTRQPASTP